MPRPILRPSLALLLACALACGPGSPDGDPTSSTATPGSTGTPTATTTSTGTPTTGAPATTAAPDDTTTTAAATTTGLDDTTTQAATTETTAGPCVIDPPNDICSAACEFEDCCKCNTHALPREPGAVDCQIAVGVVVAKCGWQLESVWLDGQALVPFDCDGDGSGWHQSVQDGDIILELCGDACATYLSGEYRTLETYIYCEAA